MGRCKVGWILLAVAAIEIVSSQRQCPSSYLNNDLSWFRQNAQTLLFMEHMQQRAAQENLYDWSNQLGSDQYRSKLRNLENEFVTPDEIPEDCYEQMPIPTSIAQRIGFIEDRLESCGSGQPCGGDGGGAGAGMMRRFATLQAEVMRQRSVLRNFRLRLMTINRQCEGIFLI